MAASERVTWDHLSVEVYDRPHLDQALRDLGGNGWELVTSLVHSIHPMNVLLILKRPR